jgi:hypothetical protein
VRVRLVLFNISPAHSQCHYIRTYFLEMWRTIERVLKLSMK